MTLLREETVSGVTDGRPVVKRSRTVKATVWAVLAAGAAVGIVATARTGVAGDHRLANPTPLGKVIVGGVPRPEAPLWGVQNWPTVFGIGFLIAAVLLLARMIVSSVRQRRLTHPLQVYLAVAILAWLDPPANWVTFTIYDPRLAHFPTSWPWIRLSPSVEPILVVPGYPFYYFTIALLAFFLGRRFVLPRLRAGTWLQRHPALTLFGVGVIVGFLWDVPTELLMLRARMYVYSQSWGPRLHWGHGHPGLPLVWSLYTVFSIAAVTPLLYRSDDGGSLMSAIARRLPRRRNSSGRQVIAGVMFLSVVYLVLIGAGAAIRVSHTANRPFNGQWPYGEMKTYDPYGTLRTHGIPGPYYR